MSHIITCAGNGGMVLLDDEQLRDRGLMLRRWGRRSEPHLFGSQAARTGRVFREDLDGIPYDNDFIFDVQPWNFEPSELGAAYGLVQLDRLAEFTERRRKNFEVYTAFLSEHPDAFVVPRQLDGLETAWLCYGLLVTEDAGFERPDLQEYLDTVGVDTRTIWSGNITRHPMMQGVDYRKSQWGSTHRLRRVEPHSTHGGSVLPVQLLRGVRVDPPDTGENGELPILELPNELVRVDQGRESGDRRGRRLLRHRRWEERGVVDRSVLDHIENCGTGGILNA